MASSSPSVEKKLGLNAAKDTATKSSLNSKKTVADSWEDEDLSDANDASATSPPRLSAPSTPSTTSASPDYGPDGGWASMTGAASSLSSNPAPGKRPEKTDAIARRMIAAGLGLKASKQTEEQKAYQKAVREQENKKREQEKAEEQRQHGLIEKAKAAIWDD